jgi:polyribonucleotide nucleotidyltransferase
MVFKRGLFVEIKKQFHFGDHQVTLITGKVATQADGAVWVEMGDTVVLVTAVVEKNSEGNRGFLPLTVNYQEKYYAAGRFPGGFLKREGRPNEKETLTSRLIDRPLRPLFAEGFTHKVQVVATVLSLDPEVDGDVPAMLGASAALAMAGVPFAGPIGCARVGYQDGVYMLNPTATQLQNSKLDLFVAGTDEAVLMVESQAQELSEDIMLGAVLFGHEHMQLAIQTIKELAQEAKKPEIVWQSAKKESAIYGQVEENFANALTQAYTVPAKQERQPQIQALRQQAIEMFVSEAEQPDEDAVLQAFQQLEKKIVRSRILAGEARIDGRDQVTVRPISIETGLLPRAHGSALFTRGETQALVSTTLGAMSDAQILDDLAGEDKDLFLLHYNFPPFCVGETGMIGAPKRREIGHGRLARRGIEAVLPSQEDFPYVTRVVSEVLESNGSSSMATVCGASLALMDAGVPVKTPVAGVAMGLIKEGEQFAVLTDILGDEDHLGDMDFKVAGTETGVTALQMDIKITGINRTIMSRALDQARRGRLHILTEMNKAMATPKQKLSQYAPRMLTLQISKEKIGDVIGKGGATIRGIIEETGASVDISDDGKVSITAEDENQAQMAKQRVEELVQDVEVGVTYEGKVVRIMDFGAFVSIMPGRDGLVHISQIADERINNIADYLSEGQQVRVQVLAVDNQGRIKLSMRSISQDGTEQETQTSSSE